MFSKQVMSLEIVHVWGTMMTNKSTCTDQIPYFYYHHSSLLPDPQSLFHYP
jgi:hypothetical protein